MEQGQKKWGFQGNQKLNASSIAIRGVLNQLLVNRDKDDQRSTIILGGADPTMYPSYRTTPSAVDAITDAVWSFKFNCYPPTVGVAQGKMYVSKPST